MTASDGSAASGAAPARRSRSAAETEALGVALAAALADGDVVALSGPLGAGKTCFVTGLARGLGCRGRVRSPSFTLINEYAGRVRLLHLDLYRIDAADVEALGIHDEQARGVLVVEWGEKLPAWARAECLTLAFAIGPGSERTLTASATAGRGEVLRDAWRRLPAVAESA